MSALTEVQTIAGKMKNIAAAYARSGKKSDREAHADLGNDLALAIAKTGVQAEIDARTMIEGKGKKLVEVVAEAKDIQAQNVELAEQIAEHEAEIKRLRQQRSANFARYHNVQKERNQLEHFAKTQKLDYSDDQTWLPTIKQAGDNARQQAKAAAGQ